MGKGDKRTRRGKIWKKSYGKTRPHKDAKSKGTIAGQAAASAKPRVKTAASPAAKAPRPKPAAPPRVPGPLPGPTAEPATESGS